MIDKSQIDQAPKQFIDSSLQGYAKEYFVLLFGSGNAVMGFSISPIHFKQIASGMLNSIKQYEERYGIIEVGATAIPSPIQLSNLGQK